MSEETQMPSQSFFGLPKELVRRAILYIKGDTGARGPQGPQGEKGDKGDAATVSVGMTTTLPAGSSAGVENSGTSSDAVFDFAIPQGPKGDKGDPGDPQTPSDVTPQMDGAGAAGTATTYARGDHQHPTCIEASSAGPDGVLTVSAPVRASESVVSIEQIPTVLGMNEAFASGAKFGPVAEILGYGPVAVRAEWEIKNPGGPSAYEQVDIPLAGNLAPAFSASSTYAVGAYCTHEGLLYKCTTAVSTAGAWNAANWSAVSAMGEMPAPITVDSAMSSSSTNPVQNKVVDEAVKGRVPWANSSKNAVTIGTRSGAVGDYSVAQGISVTATGARSHAEGDSTTATEGNAHAEGYSTSATGVSSHAEGRETTAAGAIAHSEGLSTYAAGRPSHAEGSETTAAGIASHADGYRAVTAASGNGSGASTPHDYAFAWQGVSTGGYYRSHGAGTYNINPVGGTEGFYVGEDSLASLLAAKAAANERNLLAYASTTTLAPETAVYRSALASDGTFPTITATGIPTAAAYYQFELELAVPSTVPSTITGPSGWTWLDGHGLPDPADLSGGETICISVRLDCTARTFLASVWRVA